MKEKITTSKGDIFVFGIKELFTETRMGRGMTLKIIDLNGNWLEFDYPESMEIYRQIFPPAEDRLTFAELRKTNLARCEESFHSMDEWSLNDWLVALGGEVGEAMNYAKKLRRLEGSKPGVRAKMSKEELLTAIKKEFGDIGTYLDLAATKLGFRLEDCIRDKFNEISSDIGSERKL